MEDLGVQGLHIDLYNFDDRKFETSPYILTSPRSLDACLRLSIKPVELLPRSLEDFMTELVPLGTPLRAVHAAYREYERERKNKLQLCREERQMICGELNGDSVDSDDEVANIIYQGSTSRDAHTPTCCQNRTSLHETQLHSDERVRPHSSCGSLDRSSLRKRAASCGRPHSHLSVRSRRRSLSDRGYFGSSADLADLNSSVPSLRSYICDSTPVVDPVLRRKLGPAITNDTRLRTKDQKILSLMLAKKEQEEQQSRMSWKSQMRWERERRKELDESSAREASRWETVSRQRHQQNLVKTEEERIRSKMEENLRAKQQQQLELSEASTAAAAERQHHQKMLLIQKKQLLDMKKKRQVDMRIEQQKLDWEDYQNQVKSAQEESIQRANSVKLTKEQQQIESARRRNYMEKQLHSLKMKEIKKQNMNDLSTLQETIEQRHDQTERKLNRLKHARQMKLIEQARELDRRLYLSRTRQMESEKNLEEWQQQLINYQRNQEKHAMKVVENKTLRKSERAFQTRTHKQQEQREKMKKLLEEEAEWKKELQAVVAHKDFTSKTLQAEKEQLIEQSRALAGTSQRLREEVRMRYITNDMAVKNKQTVIENKILFRGPRTSVAIPKTNQSTVVLG